MALHRVLRSTEAYNCLLRAVIHIPVIGSHYTTYSDMVSSGVEPNLDTFHLLLDGTLAEGSIKSAKRAVFHLWRSLMKEWPRIKPDVDVINKFIRCCLTCKDNERAFVFLSALSDCAVEPNVETFTLLFKVHLHSALQGA